MHAAGLTPSVLPPTASRTLPEDYNVGITNLIERPTREVRPARSVSARTAHGGLAFADAEFRLQASELGKAELEAAVPVLLAKVARYRPKCDLRSLLSGLCVPYAYLS